MAGLSEHGNEPSGFIKAWHSLTIWVNIKFSRNPRTMESVSQVPWDELSHEFDEYPRDECFRNS